MKAILQKLSGAITGMAVEAEDDAESFAKDMIYEIAMLRHSAVTWGQEDPKLFREDTLNVLDRMSAKILEVRATNVGTANGAAERLTLYLAELASWFDAQPRTPVHAITDVAVREAVWNLTDGHCAYCGSPLTKFKEDGHSYNFCVEHVVPKSQGGPDNLANYVPACIGCNNAKKANHVLDFIQGNLSRRPRLVEVPNSQRGEVA